MRVMIQNLGIIQQAEIDLKPLTILIGPNNAGKTWIAYTLAGIFGSHGWNEYAKAYVAGKLPEKYPPLDQAIEDVIKKKRSTINLSEFAENYGETYFQNVANYAQQWLQNFMSTQFATFTEMQISVNIAPSKEVFLQHLKKYTLNRDVANGSLTINKKRDDFILHAYTSTLTDNNEVITEEIPENEIRRQMVDSTMQMLHRSLYPQIFVFPTERTALVTFPYHSSRGASRPDFLNEQTRELVETIRKALRQLEELSTDFNELLGRERPRKAIEPVGHFLNMLSSIFNFSLRGIKNREKEAKSDSKLQKYIQLAQMLEDEVLAGGLTFSASEPEPRRDILFHPTQEATLEIPIVSSMVKELAPLALYLRYLAQPDELLIIDEPEMNLHPEAQVKIIEFLAMLVNAGLRVLVTTHSPYMVDHLVNLMRAADHPQEEQPELAEMFFLQNTDAFIAKKDVSVYLVDKGTAENILQEDGRIEWSTFGNISDQVADIHFKL